MKKVLLNVFDRFMTLDYWTKVAMSGVSIVLSFLAPIWPFILCIILLVFLDMYTGIKKARRKNVPIISRSMYRTIEKMLTYICLILGAELVNVIFYIPGNLTYVVSLPIAMTELYSIMENTEAVSGANLIDRVKSLIPGLEGSKRNTETDTADPVKP
jgi:phage-related holin